MKPLVKEKYSDSLIVSRLQQIEIASLKPSLSVDSPFFHLLTVTRAKPFFDNLPLGFGIEFRLIGSKILGAQIERGYFFHNLEESLSTMLPWETFVAISRLNFSWPIFYQAALFVAYRRLANVAISREHAQFFTVAMEFSRAAHHLSVVKNVLYCLKLFALAEIAIDCAEILQAPCKIFNRLRTKLDPEVAFFSMKELGEIINEALNRTEELSLAINLEEKVKRSLQKKAVVSISLAGSMGLSGLFLRSNQDLYDLRRQSDYGIPYLRPPRTVIGEGGDAWTRFSLRSAEIISSLRWLKQTFQQRDSTDQLNALVINEDFCNDDKKRPFSFGEIEGLNGTIKVNIFITEDQKPIFCIRSPAYFVAQAIPHILKNLDLKDAATILFSLGISAEEVDK